MKFTITQMVAMLWGTFRFFVAVIGFIPHLQAYRKKLTRN